MEDTYSHYSRTVDYYRRYRPRYPGQLIEWLKAECDLLLSHVVADIGSGTGQMAELFLKHGNPVFAIEPNVDMRLVAENELRAYPLLTSIGATAEATTLPDQSIHLITVGNAFHWFDHGQTREEFLRILVPGGWVVLAWNLERNNGSPFADDFELFWQKHIDPSAHFLQTKNRKRPDYINRFFGQYIPQETTLDNYQVCDFDALRGVVLSTLKAPQENDLRFIAMEDELKAIFNQYQDNGTVMLEYDTAIVYGQLSK